jgi:hypothetical protein
MEFVTSLHNVDVVMKQSGPELPCSNDILGSGHTREVTPASAIVEIIQDSAKFVDGKTLLKNGVDPASIENVFDEEVVGGLMVNASTIILREMRPKIFCAKVYKEVVVLGVIGGDEEEVLIKEILIYGGRFSIRRKGHNEFSEDDNFLSFGSREL